MSIADLYEAFLLDLDGVLYRAESPVPHAAEAVDGLRRLGRAVVFVTNNSSRTPQQVADKLGSVGIRADAEEVVTSALATADLMSERGISSAFVIGEDGVNEALARAGVRVIASRTDDGAPVDSDLDAAEAVVVGWDRGITYDKLRTAALLVQRGAILIATNADPSYPAPDGLWPGAGALLSVIVATTGVEPLVVGKPHAPLFEAACRRAGVERPLVVGDRLDTDIAGAVAFGLDSMLVLTGISTRREAREGAIRPTYVGEDLRDLFAEAEPRLAEPQKGSSGRGGA